MRHLLAALGLLLLAVQVSLAQAPRLALNVPVEGSLAAGGRTVYEFVSRTGAMLSFVVQPTDSAFDPVLTIETLEGVPLLQNNDASPATRDAIVEGFSVPRNGTYRLIVTGFGESAGSYRLLLLPGYASLRTADSFSTTSLWQTLLLNTGETLMDVDTGEGNLRLTLEGADQTGIVSVGDRDAVYQDVYVRINVNLTWRNDWQVGLVLRHQDEQNYYLFEVNSAARWRMVLVQNGEERLLQDWQPHPALTVRPQFTLAALLNGNQIEVFYQDELIGRVVDDTLLAAGRTGFFVGTANRSTAQVIARFDDWIVTQPLLLDGQPLFPAQIVVAAGTDTLRELQRRRLLTGTGTLIEDDQRSNVQDTSAGITRIEMVPGRYRQFALGGTVYWSAGNEGIGGCGLTFREQTEPLDYLLAFFDTTGAYGLARRTGDRFAPGLFIEAPDFRGNARSFVIVASADRLYYYVDGRLVPGNYETLNTALPAPGAISRAVVNFDPVRTVCDFQGFWLWSMDEAAASGQ
ncbi:MAG: hypothetical protein MUE40_05330 [Anaerolineae bacterium]|nr:hypothetical protein [Anaerolineae bacterium]